MRSTRTPSVPSPHRKPFAWTERDTLLYALGVGAGTKDLAFTTRTATTSSSRYCPPTPSSPAPLGVRVGEVGTFNFGMLLQRFAADSAACARCRRSGKLNVHSEVVDIQD